MFCDGLGFGEGMEVHESIQEEGIYIYINIKVMAVWQKPTQHCKTITLQLKKKKKHDVQSICLPLLLKKFFFA